MFAVAVTFAIDPGHWDAFLPLLQENASLSRNTEPGCRLFDIALDADRPHTVFLYELYDDPAAFQEHLQTTHFMAFDQATAPMITAKTVHTYREVIR